MNRFMKLSLLVGAALSVTSSTFCAPAEARNDHERHLNELAVQMYADNVAKGMDPTTGGIYSPYVNGTIRNSRNRRFNNNGYYSNYYNNYYGDGNSGWGNPYAGSRQPSVWSRILNGVGY